MDKPDGQTTDATLEADKGTETPQNTAAEKTEDPKTKPGLDGGSDAAKPILLEIFRSGWTQEGDYPEWGIQGRAFDQSYVKALAENTTRMMQECGLKVPIVLNHPTGWLGDEQREAAEGWVLSVESRELEDKDPKGRPELALVAECIMEGQLKEDYEAGRLPKRSIGWSSEGRLPNGRLMGPYLQHLGLLGGRSQPAIPALQDMPLSASVHVPPGYQGALYDPVAWSTQHAARMKPQPNALQKFADSMKAFMTGIGQRIAAVTGKLSAQNTAQTETTMTIEEIKEALAGVAEYYSGGMAALEELMMALESEEEIEGGEPDSEEPVEEPAATEDTPEEDEPEASAKGKPATASAKRLTPSEIKLNQQLAAKERENQLLKQAQAETRFAELAREGKVNASAKEKFLKVAASDGLSTAEDYFTHEPAADRPKPGRVLGTPATGTTTPAEVDAIKNRARQIVGEYGTNTAMYRAEKARALAADKSLEAFFAELESPTASVNTPTVKE